MLTAVSFDESTAVQCLDLHDFISEFVKFKFLYKVVKLCCGDVY